MKPIRRAISFLFLSIVILGISAANAADTPKEPSGTVNIDETQFALIIGGSTGSGILTYQEKQYPFKTSGMSLGVNVDISKVSASGAVYDPKELSQLPGPLTKLESSITLGGVGGIILENENGVIMRLTSTSEGLQPNLSASSVTVKFGN